MGEPCHLSGGGSPRTILPATQLPSHGPAGQPGPKASQNGWDPQVQGEWLFHALVTRQTFPSMAAVYALGI